MNVPYGYCHCGCGGKTTVAEQTRDDLGHVKGEPIRYLLGHAMKRPVYVRLREDVVCRQDGCWEWVGSMYSNGYGRIAVGANKHALAHRIAYEHYVGPIPNGQHVHHKCHHRACVNPDHLQVLPVADHKKAHLSTHCKHGHEFTEENTYITKGGWRSCRECQRLYQRRRRLRAKRHADHQAGTSKRP